MNTTPSKPTKLPTSSPLQSDGEDDDFEAASQSTADYLKQMVPPKPGTRVRSKGFWIGLTALILVVIGSLYWFLLREKPAPPPAAPKVAVKDSSSRPKDLPTKQFDSPLFGLSFFYPDTWQVNELADQNLVKALSPAMTLTDKNGDNVTGRMVFTIAKPGQGLSMLDSGPAVAALESEKITYSRPTQMQRGNTYISFLQYPATTGSRALDGVYISGDFGYLIDQAIPKGDIARVDPMLSVTFEKCADAQCTGPTIPLSLSPAIWKDTKISQPIKTIFKSLAIN